MVVSELNRRLAWLKVTVCLGLPWLRPNHNVAPGNRMSPWLCANLRICASTICDQELKNWCVGSLCFSPLLVQSHLLAFPAASLIPISSFQNSQCGTRLPVVLTSDALYHLLLNSFSLSASLKKILTGAYKSKSHGRFP